MGSEEGEAIQGTEEGRASRGTLRCHDRSFLLWPPVTGGVDRVQGSVDLLPMFMARGRRSIVGHRSRKRGRTDDWLEVNEP